MNDPQTLRQTFNSGAQEYDAARPGYPSALIEDLVCLSGIPEGGQALEIGCGTGQATLPLARRGYSILCLDIGPDLLAIARENLRDYPLVRFQHTSFEQWPVNPGSFDLVFSATAFHWVPREVGYPKAALALKPGGALAVFSNMHPRPGTGFFVDVQEVYQRYLPELGQPGDRRKNTKDEIEASAEYMRSTGLFAAVDVRTYPWTQTYSTVEYLRLLNTYSDHRSIDEDRRRSLYQSIADLIERRYHGQVQRPYLSVLFLGKK